MSSHLEQRLVDQAHQQRQHIARLNIGSSGDPLGAEPIEPAGEDAQRYEQALLLSLKEIEAPTHGRLE